MCVRVCARALKFDHARITLCRHTQLEVNTNTFTRLFFDSLVIVKGDVKGTDLHGPALVDKLFSAHTVRVAIQHFEVYNDCDITYSRLRFWRSIHSDRHSIHLRRDCLSSGTELRINTQHQKFPEKLKVRSYNSLANNYDGLDLTLDLYLWYPLTRAKFWIYWTIICIIISAMFIVDVTVRLLK